MRKILLSCAVLASVGLTVSACQTTPETAMPEAKASAPMEPMPMVGLLKPNTTLVWNYNFKGKKGTTERKIPIDNANIRVDARGNGCTETYDKNFFPYASVKWEGCNSWRNSFGKRELTNKKGDIWPLEVGKQMSFHVQGYNGAQKATNWNFTTTCTVEDAVSVSVPAGTFDTYKVTCDDRADRRTWYFSPKLATHVKFTQEWKIQGGNSSYELAEIK